MGHVRYETDFYSRPETLEAVFRGTSGLAAIGLHLLAASWAAGQNVEVIRPAVLTLDHIHPWSKGGDDTPANLQTLCRPCNSRKGARI